MNPVQLHHPLTTPRRLRKIEPERLPQRRWLLQLLHLRQLLLTALRLRRLRRHRPEPLDEILNLLDLLLLVPVRLHRPLPRLLFLLQIGRIIPRPLRQLRVVDLIDLLNDLIHEIAVVRNHQHRAWIVLQITPEPQQRQQIKVVRRLVQQQQIRLDHQQPRKVRPHHPTTTELPRRPREILFLVPKPTQNLPRPRLRLRILQRLMLRLRIKIRRGTHIPALLMLLKNRLQSVHLPSLPRRNVQHRLLTHRLTLLRQIP